MAFNHRVMICLVLLATGCTTTVDMVSPDADLAPGEAATVVAGVGISLDTLDGREIHGTAVLMEPGEHLLHFGVRRNMGQAAPMLKGVFFDGECEIEIAPKPGETLKVVALLGSETRNDASERSAPVGSTFTSINKAIYIENATTGNRDPVPESRCALRLDCRRLADTVEASSACTYGARPPFRR